RCGIGAFGPDLDRGRPMKLPARVIALAMLATLTGCATTPATESPQEDDEPVVAEPSRPPMVEYPPIEPVESPAAITTPAPPPPRLRAQRPAQVPPPEPTKVAIPAPSLIAPEPVIVAPPAPPPEPTEEQQVVVLLADLQRYNGFSTDEIKREVVVATQLLGR